MLSSFHGKVPVVLPATDSNVALNTVSEAIGGEAFPGFICLFAHVPFHIWTGEVLVDAAANIRMENISPVVIAVRSILKTSVPFAVLVIMVVTVDAAYEVPDELAETVHVIDIPRMP